MSNSTKGGEDLLANLISIYRVRLNINLETIAESNQHIISVKACFGFSYSKNYLTDIS